MENDNNQGRKRRDLTGMRFGKLTVTGFSSIPYKSRETRWRCVCDCGGETDARGYELVHGLKKSCGCLKYEHLSDMRDKWALMRAERERREGELEAGTAPAPITDETKAGFTDWWMFGDHEGRQERWFNRFVV